MAVGLRMTADARKEQILEHALDVFAEKGFSGARTREIATRAGISETLIFQHFSNKKVLYLEALRHLYNGHPLHNDMQEPLAKGDDREVFRVMALHMLEHTEKDPRIARLHLFQLLEQQGVAHGAPSQKEQQGGEGTSHSEAVLAEYIAARMEQGVFAPGNPVLLAKYFHYTVFMAIVDRQLGHLGMSLDLDAHALAEQLTDCFLQGALARP